MVVTVSLVAACGDDGAVISDDTTSSETGTSAEMTFSTLETTSPTSTSTTDTTTTATSSTTTVDTSGTTDDPTTEGESESSSTGEPHPPFYPPVELPMGIDFEPLALALDDLDGDGVLDLLVTGTDGGGTVVGASLLGDGFGGFDPPIDAQVGGCSAFPITGSIDDDEAADLYFGNCLTDPVFWSSDGDGTFTATEVLDPWPEPPVRSSRFVDHDADGDQDLVLLTVGNADPELHLATHGDDLTWPLQSSPAATDEPTFDPDGLSIVNLDGDERGDALLLDAENSLAYMLAVDGGHADAVAIATDVSPTTVAPYDLDGDGDDDLVCASRTGGTLQVLSNDALAFAAEQVVDLGDVAPLELAVGRWGNGNVHVAVLDAGAPHVQVLESDGVGLDASLSIELPSLAVRLLHGDLNGDGVDDLVAATFAAGSVTVILGWP